MSYRLLDEFEGLFNGKKYIHRDSSRGDWVAHHLYEDLFALGKSKLLIDRINRREHVLNVQNKRHGIKARRGDGTFGEIIPGIVAIVDSGFSVGRGPIANVEIGVEVKIMAKAMIKQVDRVKNDLKDQVAQFNRGAGTPICVAIVGVNYANYCIGYEGARENRTDGNKHKHPFQEASNAEAQLISETVPKFDEFLFLRYRATNDPPYPFEWVNYLLTFKDYGSALTRISRAYDTRFGSRHQLSVAEDEEDYSDLDSIVYEWLRSETEITMREHHAKNVSFQIGLLVDALKYTEKTIRESLYRLEKDGRVRRNDTLGNSWRLTPATI